ncbi:MAG: sulfotransferase family protein [Paracoccaceae bacterium]
MVSPKSKVFCVGFQKTGTSTMEAALKELGYRVDSVYGRDDDDATLAASWVERGLARARAHDAVQDMPWPLLFRELDTAFPEARFVLTLRDEDAWWTSVLGHFGGKDDVMQRLVYGADAGAPLGNEARYRAVYRAHNAAVRAYFADRPEKLLILDFSGRVGWEELCGFLGEPVPTTPFPVAQQRFQSPSFKRTLRRQGLRLANAALKLGRRGATGLPT